MIIFFASLIHDNFFLRPIAFIRHVRYNEIAIITEVETMKHYLSIDIGGTTIKYALFDPELTTVASGKFPTNHNENNHILTTVSQISQQFHDQVSLAGIGISTAGIVAADGSIQYAGPTIPGYTGTPLKQTLTAITGGPVSVANDVVAALRGEALAGAARNYQDIYYVALGTGIGGAHLRNQTLITGAHGLANSLGYTLTGNAPTNYETTAATLALEHQLAPLGIDVITAFNQAKKEPNSPIATVIHEWAAAVAQGLANIIYLIDPEVIIIGGAVAQQGAFLENLLTDALTAIIPPTLNKTHLAISSLANKAQLIGAIAPLLN